MPSCAFIVVLSPTIEPLHPHRLKDLVVRTETNKLVTDLVNLDRVRSLLKMIIYRRRFKEHLRRIHEKGSSTRSAKNSRTERLGNYRYTLYHC